jgi:Na+-transporting methylmalonyl-CoA/oxaloacetate decarboxylase beta subunit
MKLQTPTTKISIKQIFASGCLVFSLWLCAHHPEYIALVPVIAPFTLKILTEQSQNNDAGDDDNAKT